MTKISAKFVPCLLSQEQKEHHVALCKQNLEEFRRDTSLLEKVITMDELWFSLFEPETKQGSSQWLQKGSLRPQKALRSRSTRKTMLVLFFDTLGVVHLKFVPPRQIVKTEYWLEIMRRFRDSVHRKRPVMWKGGFDGATDRDFRLHLDNAPAHMSVPSLAFYGENDVKLLSHPAYSPDLAPCDFWAFPALKAKLRGRRFANIGALQQEIRTLLRRTPKEDFEGAIYDMPVQWSKCVEAQGEYFEGTNHQFNPEDLPQETSSDSDSESD